jgi:hypothetical protein
MSSSAPRSIPLGAVVASGGLWLLAVLAWPRVAGRAMPLDWYIGDLAMPLRVLSVGLAVAAVAALIAPRRIAAVLRRILPTRRHLVFGAVALLLSTVVGLAAGELLLRALHLPFTASWEPSEIAIGRFDPDLGWSYVPGTLAMQQVSDRLPPVPVRVGRFGARVPAAGPDRDPARPTVLLVGNSFTMGHGLTYEESLAGQLERQPGFPWQVANYAVQGYGTDQSLLQLRRHIASFDTRVVIYGYICDHLRRNANGDRRLMFPGGRFLGTKPLFRLDAHGEAVLAKRPIRYEDRADFRVLDLVRVALAHYGPVPNVELTRALIRQMAAVAAAHGASFAVLDWDMGNDTDPACRPGPFDGLGVPVVRPAGTAPPGWSTWTLPGDLHPDARAAHFAAKVLARALKGVASAPGR